MAAVPMGATSNAGSASFGSKVHNAALLVGKVKTVVDAVIIPRVQLAAHVLLVAP